MLKANHRVACDLRCNLCNVCLLMSDVYTVRVCWRAEMLSLSSLLSGEKECGGFTVKQKPAINSLFQAEGDASNP